MAKREGSDRSENRAIYIISVAAELAGVHPQTLRVYERKGLVRPSRTQGNTRRYSERDIARLRRIQKLTNEGVNLAGVYRIMALEHELELERERHRQTARKALELQDHLDEIAEGRANRAMVPLKDVRRVRRALKVDIIDQAGKRRTFQVPPAAP